MKKIVRQNRIDPKELLVDKSIFSVFNGLVGMRGDFSEGNAGKTPNMTLVNGYFNTYPYHYEENSPMFPQEGEKIVTVPDGQKILFFAGKDIIDFDHCQIIKLRRAYDLQKGLTLRETTYKTVSGHIFELTEEKLASKAIPELTTISSTIKSIDYDGPIRVLSYLEMPEHEHKQNLDPRINLSGKNDLFLEEKSNTDGICSLYVKTTGSNLSLVVSATHDHDTVWRSDDSGFHAEFDAYLHPSESFTLAKYLVYTPAFLYPDYEKQNSETIKNARMIGYDFISRKQSDYYHDFWKHNEISLSGDDQSTAILEYCIFCLDANCPSDQRLSIPAKGLSGEGYEGHYFWDTEIYLIPFFSLTDPIKARQLLLYRYSIFSSCRKEAARLGIPDGVKIPWRTISGREVSPYFLAGSSQFHINSDVAYSVFQYYDVTKDENFMQNFGFEMVLETARFLYGSGNYHKGAFHINCVTGPDEYNTQVNDNYYTNSMAKYHFERLVSYYREHVKNLASQVEQLNVAEKEIDAFEQAAKAMVLLYDTQFGIIQQDQAFMQKKQLDLNKIPVEDHPLLLYYHPSFIYRHQVLKQADVLLSMFLLDFTDGEVMENSYRYYIERTTHDSSLSKCIHSIMMSRLGLKEEAYQFFSDVLKTDFANLMGNSEHGLHLANMGGAYLDIVFGFLGLRIKSDHLVLRPLLPPDIDGYAVKLLYRGTSIKITVKDKVTIESDRPITIDVCDDTASKSGTRCEYILKNNN